VIPRVEFLLTNARNLKSGCPKAIDLADDLFKYTLPDANARLWPHKYTVVVRQKENGHKVADNKKTEYYAISQRPCRTS